MSNPHGSIGQMQGFNVIELSVSDEVPWQRRWTKCLWLGETKGRDRGEGPVNKIAYPVSAISITLAHCFSWFWLLRHKINLMDTFIHTGVWNSGKWTTVCMSKLLRRTHCVGDADNYPHRSIREDTLLWIPNGINNSPYYRYHPSPFQIRTINELQFFPAF